MGCFNDPAWKVCGWWGGGGGVADTNPLYPARWGWINKSYKGECKDFVFLNKQSNLHMRVCSHRIQKKGPNFHRTHFLTF